MSGRHHFCAIHGANIIPPDDPNYDRYNAIAEESWEQMRDFAWWSGGTLLIIALDAYVGAHLFNFDQDPVPVPLCGETTMRLNSRITVSVVCLGLASFVAAQGSEPEAPALEAPRLDKATTKLVESAIDRGLGFLRRAWDAERPEKPAESEPVLQDDYAPSSDGGDE